MTELSALQKFAVWALPVLFAITVHEVAHGWVARHFGDPTAMQMGRLTLNPIKHIDPLGTLLVPGILMLLGGFIFGWAKPVPVDWRRLRSPKHDMIWVAAAGPAANLAMAVAWTLVLKLGLVTMGSGSMFSKPMMLMGVAGMLINAILMLINLLPLPPLDGGRVMTGLLPMRLAVPYAKLERWGLLIVALVLVSGVLGRFLWPLVTGLLSVLLSLADVAPQTFNALFYLLTKTSGM